ncbi:type II secretion system F family protein [Paraburkholderia sediminicola]|uniref:Type II secretion system F family protein n=1 Tax=Paraburkholderia metrosideri TaxID=580937 RepID=A0ABW9E1H6_9BURK
MSSVVMVFAALALLCTAGALLILQRGAQRKDQAITERFIDSRMAAAQSAVSVPVSRTETTRRMTPMASFAPQAPVPGADWNEYRRYINAKIGYSIGRLMNRAGLRKSRTLTLIVAGIGLALCLVAANEGGALAAGLTLLACFVFLYFVLSMRAHKRRQAIVRQLPSFLDGIVRLITLGNSVPAAFQAALQTTETPLRECLDHVSRMLRSGVEIDRALSHVASLYGARELELVGSVLRLSVKYGGRADVMLDRMASFMRDLEQAERELVAMSSETRLSSWVLGMLPVGIGGFLILTNPRYFGSMWFDPVGRQILYLAFGLQLLGAYLLYRLARLKS